jgi:hypothetical protein
MKFVENVSKHNPKTRLRIQTKGHKKSLPAKEGMEQSACYGLEV